MNTNSKTRGAALRAQRRNQDDAQQVIDRYATTGRQSSKKLDDNPSQLKLTFLGGLADVGEKNMMVVEYGNTAIVLDCGSNLSIDLPGINYEINDTTYLQAIEHKLKAYVITHGHLDHIGGLRHTVPKFPAPIYGSRYTIGVIERSFQDEAFGLENFQPQLVTVDIDAHEQIKVGELAIEFIRVTHAIPDPAAVCIHTPVGRIIATGDFRLDPEPLDNLPSDKARLKQLGDEGVLLLMSDSSYADIAGRTPTEHTLQETFTDIIPAAPGRVFVAVFSSNINRTQMIINAAVAAGRKVAFDGRSMLGYAEIAVRQGILKVPKGTIIPMQQAASTPDNQLLVMCTGGQGEPNAALQRMSEGQHKYINLRGGDTVMISSSPIPGNEISYDYISNRLSKKGVRLFRHPTHQLDGCGPLHVSGHAKREELREMIQLIRPKFFIPVHGGALRRTYHAQLAREEGVLPERALVPDNGVSYSLTASSITYRGLVPHGSLLVDLAGSVVSGLVVKDRLILGQEGIVTVVLTLDKKSGRLLASPDIVARGFIAVRDNQQLMAAFRKGLGQAAQQRFGRVDLERFKLELKDWAVHFLYQQTGLSPLVIPVVNVVGGKAPTKPQPDTDAQQRFAEMRSRLLQQQ